MQCVGEETMVEEKCRPEVCCLALSLSSSTPRVEAPDCPSHGVVADPCVPLRRCRIGMAEQFLNRPNVRSPFKKVGCKAVTDRVGTGLADSSTPPEFSDDGTQSA